MKKLTVVLILVGLLTLPITSLAEGNANPPKPGNEENISIWTYFYYVSCMIIAVAATIGIWQLFIMKHDIKTRNRRAAMENSIKLIERFNDKFVKVSDEFYKSEKKENMPEYKGTIEKLPAIDIDVLLKRLKISGNLQFHKYINELEIIAAGILSGLSDEGFAFKIIGKSYCHSVARYYDMFKAWRDYQGECGCIMELFDIWNKRLKKEELILKKKKLSDKQKEIANDMQTLIDKSIPTIK